jgi:hypothetical protein
MLPTYLLLLTAAPARYVPIAPATSCERQEQLGALGPYIRQQAKRHRFRVVFFVVRGVLLTDFKKRRVPLCCISGVFLN